DPEQREGPIQPGARRQIAPVALGEDVQRRERAHAFEEQRGVAHRLVRERGGEGGESEQAERERRAPAQRRRQSQESAAAARPASIARDGSGTLWNCRSVI